MLRVLITEFINGTYFEKFSNLWLLHQFINWIQMATMLMGSVGNSSSWPAGAWLESLADRGLTFCHQTILGAGHLFTCPHSSRPQGGAIVGLLRLEVQLMEAVSTRLELEGSFA